MVRDNSFPTFGIVGGKAHLIAFFEGNASPDEIGRIMALTDLVVVGEASIAVADDGKISVELVVGDNLVAL